MRQVVMRQVAMRQVAMRPIPYFVLVVLLAACGSSQSATPGGGDAGTRAAHSSAMALTRKGATLFVVNPDADSVSFIDTQGGTLTREVLLAGAHPQPDGNGAFTPAVMPRALVLSPDEKTLFVTGERSGKLHVIDVGSGVVTNSGALCSEPIGVLVSPDGKWVFVACSQDASVIRVAVSTLAVNASAKVATEPWALAWSADGATLLVSHFLGAEITPVDPGSMIAKPAFVVPEVAPRGDKRLAHGKPRGLYDLAMRPGTDELWIVSMLLGVDTPQPSLDFQSTGFAALTVLGKDGALQQTMSINAQDLPGENGAFADIVSGPHALTFTSDGAFALVADANSEDVLVINANGHVESSLLRPLPGHQPEGVVLSPDEKSAYVLERNTNDVVVLDVSRTASALTLAVVGTPIATLAADPMPATLRLGQHLFYSANSDEYPITKNHWVACATCHMEGRSDAVTWLFAQGPRDTPTNAGGVLGTGFLFRTADRVRVQDYWRTVNVEQGGHFDAAVPQIASLLDAVTSYVNLAIPAPIPPTTDPTLVVKGATVFQNAGCGSCHSGPRLTDSGDGNPTLDLAGSVLLHDVGTCVSGGTFSDVAHLDIDGHPRAACMFDTPSLNGIASTPPYLHDGSAASLADVAKLMVANTGHGTLSPEDLDALVEYLKSL